MVVDGSDTLAAGGGARGSKFGGVASGSIGGGGIVNLFLTYYTRMVKKASTIL